MPYALPETLLPTTVVRELKKTSMPARSVSESVSGLPITWFFATVVLTLLKAMIPPATLPMARYGTVSHNCSVTSAGDDDHERVLVLEAPDREARNAHIPHARPGELEGFEVHVA